jgi:hypothetical protein
MSPGEREKILDEIYAVEGVYVISDPEFPGRYCCIVSMGGKVYATLRDIELRRDGWKPDIELIGSILIPE